jgi:hypothetical protein
VVLIAIDQAWRMAIGLTADWEPAIAGLLLYEPLCCGQYTKKISMTILTSAVNSRVKG